MLTQKQAQEICDSIDLNSEFFDESDEEYILLKANNPDLLEAYEQLFTIAYSDEEAIAAKPTNHHKAE